MNEAADGLGSIATGALIAREIERARDDRPAIGHAEREACANCGAVRHGPYCHECGQAGHVHRSLGAFVHDIAHGVFHFEGKVWHTLPLLAWRPGVLTRRYVHGERARFVSPMALFLFSVFLMFAVVSNLAGHGTSASPVGDRVSIGIAMAQAHTRLATLESKRATTKDADARATLEGRIADAANEVRTLEAAARSRAAPHAEGDAAPGEAMQGVHADTGWHWLDASINRAAQNPQLVIYKMKSYAYKYSWALIPISLPFLWLLFALRRDVTLYDHAIFATYSLSFMSLAVVALTLLSLVGTPSAIIVLAVLIVPPLHMYRQLKGAYRLGRFGAVWRTIALLFITAITSTLFLAFLLYLGTD